MALFEPPAPADAPADRRARRRRLVGWSALLLAVLAAVVVAVMPSPYLVERPGPVFDTLGSAEYEGEDVPLITIEGTETYPTAGSLDLLTVSVQGNVEQRPTWAQVLSAWFRPSLAVVPVEAIYPSGVSNEQVDEQNAVDMENSQQAAIAAALVHEGMTVPSSVVVSQVSAGGPAEGVLQVGDRILAVSGTSLESGADVYRLRGLVADAGTDAPADVVV